MNETTEKLIRDLAEKLGTTADHLWGVLCRQAPISGITNLIVMGAWAALIIWGFKLVSRKTKKPPKTEEYPYPSAEWDGDGVALAWAIWGIGVLITMSVFGGALEVIAGSLLNPEYWALKQIVK